MLDINFIRQNPERVKQGAKDKGVQVDIDHLLELDRQRRGLIQKSENLRAQQKKLGKDNIEKAKDLKESFRSLAEELDRVEKEFNELMRRIPNLPLPDVPIGKDETENKVIEKRGKIPELKFLRKDHLEIGESLNLIDVKRAAKVAGARFSYLKKEAALLEFALINFVSEILTKKSFIPVMPPVMIKPEMAQGMGYIEQTNNEDAFFLPEDKLYLIGTSEQTLGAMHAQEIFEEKDLPKRYFGFSTCFRREAGSYGKDTRGIFRVHQFDKVEMFIFAKPENSKEEHQLLLSIEKELMDKLGLPYQVVRICSGDMAKPTASQYDIETWIPSQNRYRETHSTSNCTDFQARRLDIRYRNSKTNKLKFVHTLNGTAFAIGRTLIAILENYQRKDGKIDVPKVLQKYLPRRQKVIPFLPR